MIRELHRVVHLLEHRWDGKRALVVGDVMLDRYVWGQVERISPEAPVPVVLANRQTEQPGGAANVAMNIASLGAPVTLLGFCGDDAEGTALRSHLERKGIQARLTTSSGHPTTSKLRILGGQQQMLRLDIERPGGYPEDAFEELLQNLRECMGDTDVLVLSDYAKGVLTEDFCRNAIQMARERQIPVLVDPKQRSFERYRGATTICPNLQEISAATGVPKSDITGNIEASHRLVQQLDLQSIVLTLSEKGIAVVTESTSSIAPAVARQVFDVSGAGDTVIATLALSIAAGMRPEAAIELANVAAGIVVAKVGTVPVSYNELLSSLTPQIDLDASEKVVDLQSLAARVQAWKASGEKVVFTNGCFDLLHIGHITLLERSRQEGDRLVVAINADASVRGLKGESRPIVGQNERARVLAALAAVDAVVVFGEPTPLETIMAIRPDVIVKGGDYTEDTVVGAPEVRSWGGRVVIVPTVEGFSTTRLIGKAAQK